MLAALAIGLPTDVVPNPWFSRMTPVRDLDVVFWAVNSLLLGLVFATFAGSARPASGRAVSAGAGSGLAGVLAVGCPVCNKAVVALLGVSGALTYFEPLQPVLGAAGVALAAIVLIGRLRLLRRPCPVAPRAPGR